jgi:hypothetical protein
MALWGNNDNVGSDGTVTLDYTTKVVTGAGTSFGIAGGCAVGDVIKFGSAPGTGTTYYGDARIASIASSESLTIASTAGLSGAAIGATGFQVSQQPAWCNEGHFSELNTQYDSYVYGAAEQGIQAANATQYEAGVGWVGVTTYNDQHGNLRVKKEILVAMSGITTGNTPLYDGDPLS